MSESNETKQKQVILENKVNILKKVKSVKINDPPIG
jgi:hypothetical protein